MDQPNPIAVLRSIVGVLIAVDKPHPDGTSWFDHSAFGEVLSALGGIATSDLTGHTDELDNYLSTAARVDPDDFNRAGALAFWINVYNAGALRLAARAQSEGLETVLRVPGSFSAPFVNVAGEQLSLDAIEHAKVRRFGDPRVHGALVCGSVSCPTLRTEVYEGAQIDFQLDDQMKAFLKGGGAEVCCGVLRLSRVFNWFGSDFVSPTRMPTFLPSPKRRVVAALKTWLELTETFERIEYQSYDWGLRCSVGPG